MEKYYYIDYFKECYPESDDCGYRKTKSSEEAKSLKEAYQAMGYQAWIRIEHEED